MSRCLRYYVYRCSIGFFLTLLHFAPFYMSLLHTMLIPPVNSLCQVSKFVPKPPLRNSPWPSPAILKLWRSMRKPALVVFWSAWWKGPPTPRNIPERHNITMVIVCPLRGDVLDLRHDQENKWLRRYVNSYDMKKTLLHRMNVSDIAMVSFFSFLFDLI